MSAARPGPVRTVVFLTLAGLLCAGLLAVLRQTTEPRIAAAQRDFELKVLTEVMPAALYSNDLTRDSRTVTNPQFLGGDEPRSIYFARRGGQTLGVVIETVAPNGYSGDIRLLVGITADGVITGVRVTEHRETPGLGDKIEPAVSDWILGFDTRSLANTPERGWSVAKRGGDFDSFTGATVTPAAVVQAVHQALLYFDAFRDTLLTTPEDAAP